MFVTTAGTEMVILSNADISIRVLSLKVYHYYRIFPKLSEILHQVCEIFTTVCSYNCICYYTVSFNFGVYVGIVIAGVDLGHHY